MQDPRVLIFSASFGAGHVRAAEALIEAIHQIQPGSEITHLDCWAILNKTFTSMAKDLYISMLKHTPHLYGGLYDSTANFSSASLFHRFFDNTGQSKYLRCIQSFKPDLIICTYHTVAGAIADLKLRKLVDVPLVVVITDYSVHNQWIHPGVDLYIVGSDDIHRKFVSRDFDPDQVKVTGIPVSPRFEYHLDQAEIRARLGLLPDRPTCLIMAGAYGVLSEIKDLCQILAKTSVPAQTIVVCGRDEGLYKSLDDILATSCNPMIRFGFVDNVEELMSAADIMVTKAGGLTVSEALAKRLPMIIYKPIPGVEQANAAFLEKIGAGQIVHSQEDLERLLLPLLEQPKAMRAMQEAASQALPGSAAKLAVQHMLHLVGA